jgi:exopolysaccharide production protein ExoQ
VNSLRKYVELIVLGSCTFVLTQALLALVLAPGDTPEEGNGVWKAILALNYLAVSFILVADYRQALRAVYRNGLLVVLVFLALASCLWAYDSKLVLQRSIGVLGTTLFGIALAVRLSLEQQLRLMSWVFRIIAVLSLACIVLVPKYGISDWPHEGDWRGIFGHKNGLGACMALAVLVEWHLPAETRGAKFLKITTLLLSSVLLVFSNSITSMIAVACALVFIETYKWVRQRLRVPMFAIVSAILLAIVSGLTLIVGGSEVITGALGRSSNLTGRTDIWRAVMSFAMERPVLGYGFSGFWGGAAPESEVLDRRMGFHVMYSHNGYLDIFLTLGAVGILLALLFLWIGIKRAFERSELNRSILDFWPLAFVAFFLLYNAAECTILVQDLQWALLLSTVISTDEALFLETEDEEVLLVPSEEFS